jgi:hypothetical protein
VEIKEYRAKAPKVQKESISQNLQQVILAEEIPKPETVNEEAKQKV